MSCSYWLYLIPDDPAFKPGPRSLSRLVTALYADGYVNASPVTDTSVRTFEFLSPEYEEYVEARRAGCLARIGPYDHRYASFPCPCSPSDIEALGECDYQLTWEVDDLSASGLKYPIERAPFDEIYYKLEMHVATDYVYHCSEIIEPFDRPVVCRCGQLLEYDPDSPSLHDQGSLFPGHRIYRSCPRCGEPSRLGDYTIRLKSGPSGKSLGLRPGGVTYLFAIVIDCGKCYDRDEPGEASARFLDLCQKAVGTQFVQIGDFG